MFLEQGNVSLSYEAVLMDMDGVLIDTQQSIIAFWQQLAATYHLHLAQEGIDQHIAGRSAHHTITTLFPPLDAQRLQAIYHDLHEYEASLQYQEVSGAIAFLNALKAHHIPVALVTGAGRWKVTVVLEQLGLEPFFTAVVTGDDVQNGKPAPDSYVLAAQHLGKEPQSCLVFEDAVNGVLAAQTAQMRCIGVQTTAPARALIAAGASCVIPDFTAVRVQAASSPAQKVDLFFFGGTESNFRFPFKSSS